MLLVAATQQRYWVTFRPVSPSPAGTRYTEVASLPIFVDSRWLSVGLQTLMLYTLEALSVTVSSRVIIGEYLGERLG